MSKEVLAISYALTSHTVWLNFGEPHVPTKPIIEETQKCGLTYRNKSRCDHGYGSPSHQNNNIGEVCAPSCVCPGSNQYVTCTTTWLLPPHMSGVGILNSIELPYMLFESAARFLGDVP